MTTPELTISQRIDALFRACGGLSLLAEAAGHPPLDADDDEIAA